MPCMRCIMIWKSLLQVTVMTKIKTYTASIKITFDVHEKENPRMIAKGMSDYHNGMRGANLYTYGALEKLTLAGKETAPKSA